mmetsp:Transcript_62823/g.152947  ORF Transcript_62823/g.152947 Transcript_62823/m.152947 type:complete len:272 (-) Transcript_62823:360-1175(-)
MMITMKKALALLLVVGCADQSVYGFVTRSSSSSSSSSQTRSDTMLSLHTQPSSEGNSKASAVGASSFFAAAVIAANVLSAGADPAMAFNNDNLQNVDFGGSSSSFDTTQLLAARSGGRAGGRSAGGRSAPSPAARSRSSSTTTNTRVIERTRYVPTPGVGYGGPSVIVAPPMYNPFPGYGLGLGLNAVNQIGNDMRDYRQENEIQSTRAQLQQSQMREAEMEARLRQLESASQQQGGQLSPQQQQQLLQLMQQQQQILQQQPGAAAATASP